MHSSDDDLRPAVAAVPGEVGDLPKGIGRPATRALAGAGITTLAQVAALTDAELLAMHGVGPRAVHVLRETLESLRDNDDKGQAGRAAPA
jgi:predicted flap endonuclease-1-like 5' DNA nuclease